MAQTDRSQGTKNRPAAGQNSLAQGDRSVGAALESDRSFASTALGALIGISLALGGFILAVSASGLAGILLDLSKLDEAGAASRPAAEPIDIQPVLWSVVESIAPRLSQAGLHLVIDVPGTLPGVRVWAEDVEAVAINLLDDALKYTPAGGTVRLATQVTGNSCQLRIENSGPGIPAEDLPHILERFYRMDKARSRQTGQNGETAGCRDDPTPFLI